MQETWIRSLGGDDPLKEEMAPVLFLPGKFHAQRSLASYSPQGRKELDMTEQLSMHAHTHSSKHTNEESETTSAKFKLYFCSFLTSLNIHRIEKS